MGIVCSKVFDSSCDSELTEIRTSLANLLLVLSPAELLIFAMEDVEIYDICKNHPDLRQACIVAAVRKYHTEKFFYEEVYNRTADYMIMLDQFIQIQDAMDTDELEEKSSCECFPRFWSRNSDRIGDASKNRKHN